MVYVAYFRYKGKFIGNRYGPGSGTIWLHTTRCIGNEISIANCYHRIKADHCNHSQDVSVSCGTSPVHFGKDINKSVIMLACDAEHFIHNFIRQTAAQIKLVKTKKNKQNVNKVHRTIKSYNYHQLLTSKNDV